MKIYSANNGNAPTDAIALVRYFEILAAWNGTGETWTIPYEVLPG